MNTLTKTQSTKLNSFKHTVTKIRYLHSLNFTNSEIKNELKIIYQFVYNVLNNKVPKNPKETF